MLCKMDSAKYARAFQQNPTLRYGTKFSFEMTFFEPGHPKSKRLSVVINGAGRRLGMPLGMLLSPGPGQFLGSSVVNLVLAICLVH